jgi:hypothetical protein
MDEKLLKELKERFKETADIDNPNNAQVRKEFAQAIQVPILQEVRLTSEMRKIFTEEMLEPGAQASYPVADDFEVPVWVLPRLGAVAHNFIEGVGEEVYVPTFSIDFSEEWSLRYARESRVDIAVRAAKNAARAVAEYEEECGWRVVFPAATSAFAGQGMLTARPAPIGEVTGTGAGFLSKELLNKLILIMKRNGRTLTDLWISPEDAADIREWSGSDVDDFTRREIFQAGGLDSGFWGVQFHIVNHLGAQGKFNINGSTSDFGVFKADGSDEYNDYSLDNPNLVDANGIVSTLGETQVWGFDLRSNDVFVMPIKQNLTVYPAGNELLRHQKDGFFGWQEQGFGVLDNRPLCMGVIDRSA